MFSTQSFSQEKGGFSEDMRPETISSDNALSEGKQAAQSSGFGSAYFDSYDLYEIAQTKGAVAIRFYTSLSDKKQQSCNVMAVAIDANGNDLKSDFQRQYMLTSDLTYNSPTYARGLNNYEAENCVNKLSNSGYPSPYASHLGISNLQKLLREGVSGLRVYPSIIEVDGEAQRSMSFGPVVINNYDLKDVSSEYLRSSRPCPTFCGTDGISKEIMESK